MTLFRFITMSCKTVNILLNIPHIQKTPYINCLCMYLGRFICRGRFVQVGLSPLCQGEETINQHWIQNLLLHSLSLLVLLYICQSSMCGCPPSSWLLIRLKNKFNGSNTEKDIWYKSSFLFNKVTHLISVWHVSTTRPEDSKLSITQKFGHESNATFPWSVTSKLQ